MTYEQFIGLTIFSFIGACTPGPNNILLASIGSNVGFKKGVPAVFGVIVGFLMLCFIATIGLSISINSLPLLQQIIQWLGLLLLLWLAYKIASAPISKTQDADQTHTPLVGKSSFISLFLLQWLNPKALLVITTAVSLYMSPSNNIISDIIWRSFQFTAVFSMATCFSTFLWLGFGTIIRRFLQNPLWQRRFNVTMAALLLLSIAPIYYN